MIGLVISVVLGVCIGTATGRYRRARLNLEPYGNGLYSSPTVALLPAVTFWLGLYLSSKVVIVVVVAIFPFSRIPWRGFTKWITIFSSRRLDAGLRATDLRQGYSARNPAICRGAGFNFQSGAALSAVAEVFHGSDRPLGHGRRLCESNPHRRNVVPIVVLVVIGVTLTAAAKFLETTLAPWKQSERDQGL